MSKKYVKEALAIFINKIYVQKIDGHLFPYTPGRTNVKVLKIFLMAFHEI